MAAGITEGRLFPPVTQAGAVGGAEIGDEKAIWRLVVRYARATELGKLAPLTIAGGPAPSSADVGAFPHATGTERFLARLWISGAQGYAVALVGLPTAGATSPNGSYP